MFNPKYLIEIDEKIFTSEKFICLGSQLKSIIEVLSKLLQNHIWFGADVEAFSPLPSELGIESFKLKKIGDDFCLINLCENIDQFLAGTFIAINAINQNSNRFDLSVGTEDDRFRALGLEGVLIEIRAFDTSYFSIYSEDRNLMEKLSKIYGVDIEMNKGALE